MNKKYKILVCGGRNYNDSKKVFSTLDHFNLFYGVSLVIHGNAKGADTLADNWATDRHIPVSKFPADWDKYGASAGVLRNKQMLDVGRPDLVIAFPGGRGTSNMIEQSKSRGIKVKVV